MILNFIVGFVFGITFALIVLFAVAWDVAQEKKGNNSSTSDYNGGIEDPEDKKK